ncbi:33072_t:CDS:2, partial [Gigaspora margarita]
PIITPLGLTAGDVLKWYNDYKASKRIIEIDRGGFATIFVAEWESDTYESKIVLKEIHNSENNSTKLLNEANALYKCMKKDDALINFMKCYGMSQNPITKNYVIVMQYFERGSLKRNLIDVIGKKWHKKLKILSQIAMNLKTIHEWLNKYETQQQFMKFDETIKSAITHSSLNIHSEEIYINSFMPNFYTTRPDNVRQEYELFEYNSFEQEYELFEYDSSENSRAIDLRMSSFVSAYLKSN